MVLDLTCLATRNANRRSRSSASVGARFVTVLSCRSSATALSRLCTRRPPATVFAVSPAARGSGRLPASKRRRFLRLARCGYARSRLWRLVERGFLVRVFAVAQSLDQVAAESPPRRWIARRAWVGDLLGKPIGYCRVICSGPRIGLRGIVLAHCQACCPVKGIKLE